MQQYYTLSLYKDVGKPKDSKSNLNQERRYNPLAARPKLHFMHISVDHIHTATLVSARQDEGVVTDPLAKKLTITALEL